MGAGGAFGGNRGMKPVPPEKGVFPLDHMHECDLDMKELGFGKNYDEEEHEEGKNEKIDGKDVNSPGAQSKTLVK
ncbi:hypothetical protein MKX01_000500 [Papaver californicum]|nr:hypothetical protein MKX01_000500 [Papaver californicum]